MIVLHVSTALFFHFGRGEEEGGEGRERRRNGGDSTTKDGGVGVQHGGGVGVGVGGGGVFQTKNV